jgi:acyl-CoA synthetase (AMP-forming)/AMP-acid ligase II
MPPAAAAQLERVFPDVRLISSCGQTEAGPSGIYSSPEEVRRRPDVTGYRGFPTIEVRVVDEAGRDIHEGTGELLLRGDTVMKGYWNNPQATAETIVDGWLHTGDVVRLEADGAMTVVDRLKDMIITGGRNVYSIEVENAVLSHPAVLECAIVGQPHDQFGETIVAFVRLIDGASLSLEQLADHCRPLIADYKIPRRLVVTDLPRNPSGKILKRELRRTLELSHNDA